MRTAIGFVCTLSLFFGPPLAAQRRTVSPFTAAPMVGPATAPALSLSADSVRRCSESCALTARVVMGYTGVMAGLLAAYGVNLALCGDSGGRACDERAALPAAAVVGAVTAGGVALAAQSAGREPGWVPTLIGAMPGASLLYILAHDDDAGEGGLVYLFGTVMITPLGAVAGNYLAQSPQDCDETCGFVSRVVLSVAGGVGGQALALGAREATCELTTPTCDRQMDVTSAALVGVGSAVAVSLAARTSGDKPAWLATLLGGAVGGGVLYATLRGDLHIPNGAAFLAPPLLAITGNYLAQ